VGSIEPTDGLDPVWIAELRGILTETGYHSLRPVSDEDGISARVSGGQPAIMKPASFQAISI
jgi:hypothetical protein